MSKNNTINTAGRVILAGAGCGDHDLITVRGLEVVKSCDVVVFDSLIDKRLLDFCKEGCEKICVGKRAGHHSAKQEDINALLVEKAKSVKNGGIVLRLKGGDPFVFGRGGEEIMALRENNIPYSLIPGVTSAVTAPELAGVPVTHRRTARSFHVITGHTADDLLPEQLESYAKCGGTLVFLMGLRNLTDIAHRLIKGGMSANTPAAVISKGATADQRSVRATLGDIAEKAQAENILPPAVTVVGDTAAYDLSPTYIPPLYGVSAAITSTLGLAKRLIKAFGDLGAYAYRCGGFDIVENKSEKVANAFENIAAGEFDWIALTSPNGAEIFIKRLKDFRIDLRRLSGVKIAAIGSGTAKKLENAGLIPDLVPEKYNSADFGEALAQNIANGKKLCILRSSEGSAELLKPLEQNGIAFEDIHTYEPCYGGGEVIQADYAIFASAGGVRSFFGGGGQLSDHTKSVAIGEVTAKELANFGINSPLIPEVSTTEGIIELVQRDNAK